MPKATSPPHGRIADFAPLKGGLPAAYLQFLKDNENVEKWENVIPLEEPIETKGVACPMPWDTISKLAHYAANLPGACKEVEWGNELAPFAGLRYAYTRLQQHAHLLSALENLLPTLAIAPTGIVEIGCFTGGLIHFLAREMPSIQMVGFDISPIALDVAAMLAERLTPDHRPRFLSADFALVRPEFIPEEAKKAFERPVILLTNVLHAIGQQLSFSPAVSQAHAEAGLISYWVNNGALVIVCERGNDPERSVQEWIDQGRWESDSCRVEILSDFQCWTTRNMNPDSRLGEWFHSDASVAMFWNNDIWEQRNDQEET
jgi:hypothetical protein